MYNIGHTILLYWFHIIRLFFLVVSVGTRIQNNLVALNNNTKRRTRYLVCYFHHSQSIFCIETGPPEFHPTEGIKYIVCSGWTSGEWQLKGTQCRPPGVFGREIPVYDYVIQNSTVWKRSVSHTRRRHQSPLQATVLIYVDRVLSNGHLQKPPPKGISLFLVSHFPFNASKSCIYNYNTILQIQMKSQQVLITRIDYIQP